MNFTNEEFMEYLKTVANNEKLKELFLKGWTDFNNNLLKMYTNQCVSNLLTIQGEEKMKHIIKRKDGRYMIRKTIDGERITKYARTQAEAKLILKKFNNGKIKPEKKERVKNYTFNEYSQIWLNTYKKPFIQPKSFSEVKGFVNKIALEFGNIKLKDITTLQIQEFLNTMQRSRGKEKVCIHFNSILQKAVDTNVLFKNPFNAVIKDKKVKCKNNAFTFNEQVAILKAIKGTDIEHEIYIYLLCGCRPNELPQKHNFDFINNIININGTKNENALHRQVEMSENFSKYIQEYFKSQDTQAERYVSRKFIDICNDIGIVNPLLYRLRHTFATNHFTIGTQPKLVQQWLGHGSISITLDTYTDIDKTATKEKILNLYNNFYYIKN